MHLFFDPDFDSGAWPGPLAERGAVAGEAWVGPAGLLGQLEAALGLGGLRSSFSERAAAVVKRCRELEGFWSRSAAVDPLATARRLLEWRDRLWLEGWRGEPFAPRLKALASLTAELAPGFPDRLLEVEAALGRRDPGVAALTLFAPAEALPLRWREVVRLLAKRGCRVEHQEPAPSRARGDLAAARRASFAPKGDGSLQLLRPRAPLEAAEQVAAWLAAHSGRETTVIVTPDAVLDRALRKHGLPTVGGPAVVQDDELLQMVPLVLAVGWDPPDPQRALELLTLPAGPVRGGVARRLVAALHQWPAVGSDAWRAALDEGLAEIESSEERERLKARLEVLLRPSVPGRNFPLAEVRRRLDVVGRWMQGRMATDAANAGRWGRAYAQCSGLLRLLEESGLEAFTAPQLKRFIEEATGGGAGDAPFPPEAGLHALGSPGAVCGPAETVVWWSFDRSRAPRQHPFPLSREELGALEAGGVVLPSPGAEALLASARWSRPLLQARGTLLMVCPQRGDDGEELFPHPLFDEIDARLTDPGLHSKLVRVEPLGAGRKQKRSAHPLPVPARAFRVPEGTIARRQLESPSSAGTLLGCSFKWVLDYVGKVRGGASAMLPGAENLLGRTAHELLARLLQGPKLRPDDAHEKACELFETEGPRLAAVLFQPGAEAERARAKRATAEAARALFLLLQKSKMEVLEVERPRRGAALGTVLEGTPDVIVGAGDGAPRIIDLKWGGAKYRRESLERGTSYQLAAYSFLARKGQSEFPPTAYFIVRNQALQSTDPAAFPTAQAVAGPEPKAVWEAFEAAHAARWSEVQKGRLEAPANPDPEGNVAAEEDSLVDGQLRLAPPCGFCDFAGLCGKAFAPDVAAAEGGES